MIEGPLLIGWARGDITPPRKTFALGQFCTRIAEETLSPLTATALALEVKDDGGSTEQAIMLSCDLVGDIFKSRLLEKLEGHCPGFDLAKLSVNSTHTHTAPATAEGIYDEPENDPDFMTPTEYLEFLTDRLVQVIEDAWQARQPGSISRGFGYAMVGRCRRSVYADGSSRMYGQTNQQDFRAFESCEDHTVNMLFMHDANDQLTGMIINLACPSQCQEELVAFSADFWHNVRVEIADRYGDQVHLLPQCAPAGDLSPHLMMDQKEEKDLRERLGVDNCGIISRRIMAAVDEGLATASKPETHVAFAHEVNLLPLPKMKVTKAEYELEKRLPTMTEAERQQQTFAFQRIWPFGPVCELISRYEEQDENPNWEVESHVIRLGDVVFATNPFELYVDYATRMRCRSNALQTFLIQLADGQAYYLPTQRGLDGGHYSAMIKSNWVGPEGGQMLVDETVNAINRLFEGVNYPRTR